jgi:hypothetical protein
MIHVCGVALAALQFSIFTDEPCHYVFITTGLFIQLPYRARFYFGVPP